MPKFTPDQMARVFVSRWFARDIARTFISHLSARPLFTDLPEPRLVKGDKVKIVFRHGYQTSEGRADQ